MHPQEQVVPNHNLLSLALVEPQRKNLLWCLSKKIGSTSQSVVHLSSKVNQSALDLISDSILLQSLILNHRGDPMTIPAILLLLITTLTNAMSVASNRRNLPESQLLGTCLRDWLIITTDALLSIRVRIDIVVGLILNPIRDQDSQREEMTGMRARIDTAEGQPLNLIEDQDSLKDKIVAMKDLMAVELNLQIGNLDSPKEEMTEMRARIDTAEGLLLNPIEDQDNQREKTIGMKGHMVEEATPLTRDQGNLSMAVTSVRDNRLKGDLCIPREKTTATKDLMVVDLTHLTEDLNSLAEGEIKMTEDQGNLNMAVASTRGNLVEELTQETGNLDSLVEVEMMRKIRDLEADQNHLTGDLGNLREEMIERKELMAEDQTHLKEDQDSLAEVATMMRMIDGPEVDLIHLIGDQHSQEEEAMRMKMKDNQVVEVKTQDQVDSHPGQLKGKRMRILCRFSLLRENSCTMLRSSSSWTRTRTPSTTIASTRHTSISDRQSCSVFLLAKQLLFYDLTCSNSVYLALSENYMLNREEN